MTYEEAIKVAKDIPLSEPSRLRDFVFSLNDQTVKDQVCAKWFSIASRELKYIKEPAPPESYVQMKAATEVKNEVWRSYAKDPMVKMYMETKLSLNSQNCGNYAKVCLAIDLLHEREVAARKELTDRLVEFINGTTKERERPFPGYEFYNRADLTKYGIQPKGALPAYTGGV